MGAKAVRSTSKLLLFPWALRLNVFLFVNISGRVGQGRAVILGVVAAKGRASGFELGLFYICASLLTVTFLIGEWQEKEASMMRGSASPSDPRGLLVAAWSPREGPAIWTRGCGRN